MATITLPIVDIKGKEVGSYTAPQALFGIEPNEGVLHFVCEGQRFRFYKKTATVKTRSAVSGGGKKARKQKGSGAGRQGGNRAPHWVGGGVVFGPSGVKRDFKVNKKLRSLAMASLLSDRNSSGQIRVLKMDLDKPKTSSLTQLIETLSLKGARVGFVVSAKTDAAVVKSIRNIRNVDVLTEEKWTPLDMVKSDTLIFSASAIDGLTKKGA